MKAKLDRAAIARRAAQALRDGEYVNLGHGIPGIAGLQPIDADVTFHGENGVLGFGKVQDETHANQRDHDLINGASQWVEPKDGMSFFSLYEAFCMIRSGHLDVAVLGAYQASEKGDFANCVNPIDGCPRVGGAVDLAYAAKRIIITMTHVDSKGNPKVVRKCTYPITGRKCVDLIITDLAVMEVTSKGLLLKEYCPGWTVEEIQALTEPRLRIAEDLKEIPI